MAKINIVDNNIDRSRLSSTPPIPRLCNSESNSTSSENSECIEVSPSPSNLVSNECIEPNTPVLCRDDDRLKISDAPLVDKVVGDIKMPVSDGTKYARSMSVNQLVDYLGSQTINLDYEQLQNLPKLNTNNTSSLPASSDEIVKGIMNLHKVSKTGNYNDLNNRPTLGALSSLDKVDYDNLSTGLQLRINNKQNKINDSNEVGLNQDNDSLYLKEMMTTKLVNDPNGKVTWQCGDSLENY